MGNNRYHTVQVHIVRYLGYGKQYFKLILKEHLNVNTRMGDDLQECGTCNNTGKCIKYAAQIFLVSLSIS